MPRDFIGKGPAPASKGWNPDGFHVHARGRADATIKVLVAVAVMRSRNLLLPGGAVTVTGAKWQDWKGTSEYPRAHRFPCNPQVNNTNLPDLAPAGILRTKLSEVLAETDPLPLHVNYADCRFEECGGIESARHAVEYVATHQKTGSPIDTDLILASWHHIAWKGYVRAWEKVESRLLDRVNQEDYFAMMKRTFKAKAPTTQIESIMDVAYDATRSTKLESEPRTLSPMGLRAWLAELGASQK